MQALRDLFARTPARSLQRHAAMARVCLVGLVALLAGCVRVHAHQRETLAQPAMQAPVWPELSTGNNHVFTVREGTGGATAAGAGGCGCD